jgi:flagellar motor switch protein FliN/FliY
MTEPTDAVAIPPFRTLPESAEAVAKNDISMILDIPVRLTVEIGRTRLPIGNLLALAQGSVLELDSSAGDALDVRVNGCLVARGEAVMVGDKLGVRLVEVISTEERLSRIQP